MSILPFPSRLTIPVETAILCMDCELVSSNPTAHKCGICGSTAIVTLSSLLDPDPPEPTPTLMRRPRAPSRTAAITGIRLVPTPKPSVLVAA